MNTVGCPRGCTLVGLGRNSGMPIGLQLIGPEFSDMILIDVARLLKEECGFGFHPPCSPFGPMASEYTAATSRISSKL